MIQYIRHYHVFLILSVLCAAISVALTLYNPILIGNAVDQIIGKGKVDYAAVSLILVKMAVLTVIAGAAEWLMNICNNKISYNVIRDMRRDAFERLQILPFPYIDSHPHGEIVSRVIADVDQLSEGLLMGFTQLFTGVLTIVGTLLFMFSINPAITILVVVLTPVSLMAAAFIASRTYSMFQKQSKIRGEQTALIEEMLGNQKIVKAFAYEKESQKRFDEINDRLTDCSLKATFFSSLTNPTTRFVNALVYAAVGIFGAVSAIRGRISVGRLVSFLSYANQYTKPFNEISGVITELQNSLACADRILELIRETPEVPADTFAFFSSDHGATASVSELAFF